MGEIINDLSDLHLIEKNKEFLSWYNNKIKEGYYPGISLEEIQSLIDKFIKWNVYGSLSDNINYPDFDNKRFKQLLNTLSSEQIGILEGSYRSSLGGSIPIIKGYIDDRIAIAEDFSPYIVVVVKVKQAIKYMSNQIYLSYTSNGKLIKESSTGLHLLEEYGINLENDKTIVETYQLLKSFEMIDILELEYCLNTHRTDLELRKRIFNMVYQGLKPHNNCNLFTEFMAIINRYFETSIISETFSTDLCDIIPNDESSKQNRGLVLRLEQGFKLKKDSPK